ncbi:MAG TPA: SDR family oxidoreductase, partial [Verrucomicrobia bacterium]|nr:SDR family oxidoreductase [Verrucomicrobiota bacterium]
SPDVATSASEIRALGRPCTVLEKDLFSREGCESIVLQAIESSGRIDILVSNPAFSMRCSFLEQESEDFERVVKGTLTSGFHMSQLVARQMVKQGKGGKIVFISSVQAQKPFANSVAYNSAKAGLNQMMRTIAIELSPHRINVNAIEPGWIDTPGERSTFGDDTILREGVKLPWGRMGTPRDIGMAAAFLASEQANYITGAILPVDGGFLLKDCRDET